MSQPIYGELPAQLAAKDAEIERLKAVLVKAVRVRTAHESLWSDRGQPHPDDKHEIERWLSGLELSAAIDAARGEE